MKSIMISAGERSGDMHAAHLANAIKDLSPEIAMWGMGSQEMRQAGVDVIEDISAINVIGAVEILRHLPTYLSTLKRLKKALRERRPDWVIAVDSESFNLEILKEAKALGIKTAYYIAPQEWQWGTEEGGRKVAALCDLILAIFPEEAQFYEKLGANVAFVGHPILDTTRVTTDKAALCQKEDIDPRRPILSVFPGSRRQEIIHIFPILLNGLKQAWESGLSAQIVLATGNGLLAQKSEAAAREILQDIPFKIVKARSLDIINMADISLCPSGTITLEHAILDTPFVTGYRIHPINYWVAKIIAKRLLDMPYLTLPNIISHTQIYPEFIQEKLTADNIAKELTHITSKDVQARYKAGFAKMRKKLGQGGAVKKAAQSLVQF